MVTVFAGVRPHAILILAADATQPVLERLDMRQRAFVIGIFISLVLLGLFLIALIMLGGNWARRLARHSRGPTPRTPVANNQRVRDAIEPILPADGNTGETTVIKRKSDDTIAGP